MNFRRPAPHFREMTKRSRVPGLMGPAYINGDLAICSMYSREMMAMNISCNQALVTRNIHSVVINTDDILTTCAVFYDSDLSFKRICFLEYLYRFRNFQGHIVLG